MVQDPKRMSLGNLSQFDRVVSEKKFKGNFPKKGKKTLKIAESA